MSKILVELMAKGCEHEYGSYKGTRQLWCSDCGCELDLITRKPVEIVIARTEGDV